MSDERLRQARELSQALRRLMAQRLERKLVPYAGRWLDADEVAREQRRARRRARVVLCEVLLLFVLLGLMSYVCVALTQTLAY